MAKQKKAAAANEVPPAVVSGGPRVRNIGLRRVRVADIQDNPLNHRLHPDEQKAAFDGAESELGFFGYPDTYIDPAGNVVLVDGALRKHHLLRKYGADVEIEVNVTDFSEAEAKKALATKDALAGMAETDPRILEDLLREVQTGDEALAKMLTDMARDAGFIPPESIGTLAGFQDFQPVGEDQQGRLDQKSPIKCPECGHEWTP